MRTIFPFVFRMALLAILPVFSGCIAVLPISEYIPTTAGGTVNTSNCVGRKSVRYDFDGVPVYLSMRAGSMSGGSSDNPQLVMTLSLTEGQTVRFPTPEIRVKPADGTSEEVRALPAWQRTATRLVKPNRSLLETVTVETVLATDPLVGAKINDGEGFRSYGSAKIFRMYVSLGATPATGYRVTLPAIEINGKLHTIAPIDYEKQLRLEFMVPINC
jgi:hypothetical protein